jgi:hypothetical protein
MTYSSKGRYLMSTTVGLGEGGVASTEAVLDLAGRDLSEFDVDPMGRGFIFLKRVSVAQPLPIVVLNFAKELTRLVPN